MGNNISVVIGSWGSYHACNERAYGSKWLDLADFNSWEEIEEELTKQGFKLKGIDEELFIQDIEGIDCGVTNWDYQSPERLFNTLDEAGVLTDDYKYKKMQAYIEVRSFADFAELVEKYEEDWCDDIHLMENWSWYDYGREMFESYGNTITDDIDNFFDFEGYGKYIGDDYVSEYSGGLIEIVE